MNNDPPFKPPEVTDTDICSASRLLKLPDDAFYGEDCTDARQEVLKSMAQLDIAACPGSGKTTLLVAKLAILAEKWRYRTRGICVLSHTNVARNQIETRLGNTTAGRHLLSYPHYIGTIHGFVNEYLAMPWLRSLGYPIKMINSEICETRRWNKLAHKSRSALKKKYVERSDICISDTSFNLAKKNGSFPFAVHTPTYIELRKVCEGTAKEGYHCYDDMFIWARDIMDKLPSLVDVIRDRFPLLFVDEAQDNSEEQSAILYRIFVDGNGAVIRQRFGDENQAIFDSMYNKEADTDKFPDGNIKLDLPNSHRFGQKIAALADPLGIVSYPCGLKGQGPKQSLTSEARHTIFLFGDDGAAKVLDNYGELLLETFSDQELIDGKFTAVAQVHRQPDEPADHKFPHHISHYWCNYDPELTRPDAKPKTFVRYVFVGVGRVQTSGEAYLCVEKIAEGILRVAGMIPGRKTLAHHRHSHRYVMELLEKCDDVRRSYEDLIASFAVNREAPTKERWNSYLHGVVRKIAEEIAGASLSGPEVEDFLAWDGPESLDPLPIVRTCQDNIYRYPPNDPKVLIHVGSIHSVKGQTHTATLVLETFWNQHNLNMLKPWIVGQREGWKHSDKAQQKLRLKLHYVAMTRPAQLLCLAMKLNSFKNGKSELDN
jgi:hypothetical protein